MLTYNKDIKHLPIETIFIPEYIVNALKSRDTSLPSLEGVMKQELHNYVSSCCCANDTIIPTGNDSLTRLTLEQKLSKVDILDLVIFNDYKVLGFSAENSVSFVSNVFCNNIISYDTDQIYKTLQSLYDNNMSNNNTMPFSIKLGTDCIFVILHNAFSNYIINKDAEFKIKIVKHLVNDAVKKFGEERVLKSKLFRSYVKLSNKK